ncbi:MAG TPA: AAA family ATPase [Accumulibacter sp.]|uniref:bifunctional aminoglycoside phosphotransferase/ATP-binding protein n=1 Tax=Accumulibacter sp. TaxID=2053492 RepID=UPI00287863F7|nr:AAA family ATPase [Accumulibacter sp.]MDS4054342.1 AAA family ATPase [Accumulibacter sp.]HMV05182.1 AAA family ATPase [Accumulibacter sp.]HMW65081.1 AAA family ATPase [Accumulibacter sp.]HMW80401.1 AAA family ATPase [Accumulibacter sp.]HMX69629.1 AAA family ATPase [Accumulibacter sp.]
MSEGLPPLIRALLNPRCYPEPAATVDLVETHASWVLLAGSFAYKIKKPVVLPFLDYGTLDRRLACCSAELQLNRRFAPDLYLEVVSIVDGHAGPQIGGSGKPLEYAVKMRRFAESGRLDRLCVHRHLFPEHISELGTAIATFHQAAAVAPPASEFGRPELVRAQVLDNFTELEALLPDGPIQAQLNSLAAWSLRDFTRLAPQLAARRAGGRIRECHGDLHLGNLVLIGSRVRPFDCIEFSEVLRWIDVASEIAFTYIDLLSHQQSALAGWFINEWLSASGDYGALAVLRFYAVYRALVRAKIEAVRAAQRSDEPSAASPYLALGLRLTQARARRLIITHGVAGCGKSRAARRLVLHDAGASTIRLRSDVERKRLFGLAATADSKSPVDRGIYSSEASERTYSRLHDMAAEALAHGWSAVVDAAFLERSWRERFHELAKSAGVPFHIVAPQASDAQLRARIRRRSARGHDASEASAAVLVRQMARIEGLTDQERRHLL